MAVKETLASRTSTGRGRHRLRAPSGWTLAHREHSGAGISKDIDRQAVWAAGHVRRDIRKTHVTCLKRVEPLSFKGEGKAGLNAGGTAEHNKIIMSRPGICNSIPRWDFLYPNFLPEYRITVIVWCVQKFCISTDMHVAVTIHHIQARRE